MKVERLAIPDVILVTPPRFGDARGFFSEVFNAARFAEAGIPGPFVQDNQSLSRAKGVIRGLHCQVAPHPQGKLVRCLRGAIWDVAVDIRAGSPSYGTHAGAVLSAENWQQLWIPAGFLHGFCTLEPDTEVIYKVTDIYDRAAERGVIWNDPDLALPWPVEGEAVLSDKDQVLPGLDAAKGWFPVLTILVTGGAGQLATALDEAKGGRPMARVGRPGFDFDRPETIEACFRAASPALVVNAAAWTAVDAAESNQEPAARANVAGPALLARLAAAAGIPLIHVSTDYVFDGNKGAPYTEDDPTSPTGVYGATKLEGEQEVLAANPRAIILRTSWVYAPYGKNFIRTMLGAARKTSTLRVVADQRGCPTAAPDLAAAILAIADRLAAGWRPEYRGVFHAAGSGETSWHGLATAAFEAAARHGFPMPEIIPIATADWPTPARRPPDSRLDCARLERVFGLRLPEWRASVAQTVDRIMAAEPASPA